MLRAIVLSAFIACAVMVSPAAVAGAENVVTCTWPSGEKIKPELCDYLRRVHEKDEAEAEANRLHNERFKARQKLEAEQSIKDQAALVVQRAELAADTERQRQEKEAADAARQAKWAADADKAMAAQRLVLDRENAAAQASDRQAAKQEAARREACGADYGVPKLGMTLRRANDCVGRLYVVSKTALRGGEMTVVKTGRFYISAVDDKIVHFSVR